MIYTKQKYLLPFSNFNITKQRVLFRVCFFVKPIIVSSVSSMQGVNINLKRPRRSLLVQFTCNVCGERTKRLVNRLAYEQGLIYVQVLTIFVLHCYRWNSCGLFIISWDSIGCSFFFSFFFLAIGCSFTWICFIPMKFFFFQPCFFGMIHVFQRECSKKAGCFEVVINWHFLILGKVSNKFLSENPFVSWTWELPKLILL